MGLGIRRALLGADMTRIECGRLDGGDGAPLCGVANLFLAFPDFGVEEKGRAGE